MVRRRPDSTAAPRTALTRAVTCRSRGWVGSVEKCRFGVPPAAGAQLHRHDERRYRALAAPSRARLKLAALQVVGG
eukprot:1557648-Prymnesium_polylepis.1